MQKLVGLAFAVGACGGRSSSAPPPPVPQDGAVATLAPDAAPPPPAVDAGAPAAVVAPASVPRGAGRITLASLPVGKRAVGGQTVPTVTVPDATAQAALDAALVKAIDGRRGCKITLALPTLIALRCAEPMAETGGALTDWDVEHFAIVDGAVARIRVEDVFLPGQDVPRVLGASVGRAEGAFGRLVLGAEGVIEFRPTEDEAVVYPWDGLLPNLRGDGPLAPGLLAQGAPLPPVDAVAPAPAPTVIAYAPRALADLFAGWWRLDDAHRSAARLIAPPGDDFDDRLGFAPIVATDATAALGVDAAQIVKAALPADAAALVPARLTTTAELRPAIGKRAAVSAWLPRGALVARVDGTAHGTPSKTGGGWALVGGPGGAVGWVAGRGVTDAPCVPRTPAGAPVMAVGFETLVDAAGARPVAWVVRTAAGTSTVALHDVDGCELGAERRVVTVAGVVRDLWLARAEAADRGPSLLVVVTAPSVGAAARTVAVFADGAQPIYTHELTAGEVTGPDLRGSARSRGYAPVVLDGTIYLRWDGATLSAGGVP